MANKENLMDKTALGVVWYRIRRHPIATLYSFFFASALTILLSYILGEIYPDFKIYYKKILPFGWSDHGAKYNFYSGEKGSSYFKIGKAITKDAVMPLRNGTGADSIGLFDDNDTLQNFETGGGYENFMKVTTQKNSFSLVQNAVIKIQDEQLLKSVTVVTPLFVERLHIFYRKGIFPKSIPNDELELSANTDPKILECFTHSIKSVQVGKVGSCTRIIAGDVMDLIERQIQQNPGTKGFSPSYSLKDYPLFDAFKYIHQYGIRRGAHHSKNPIIDVMFYVGADPTEDIRAILDSGRYGLISVCPSFLNLLNIEFKMNLQVADFQKKYDKAAHVSTVGTFSSLIASREIQSDDVIRMLTKISLATKAIQKSFIQLHSPCTDLCYIGLTDSCHYTLPLAEFGFYKFSRDEARQTKTESAKAAIPFLITIIGFFFPILKSVSAFNSIWRSWRLNQEIDLILSPKKGETPKKTLWELYREIADLYGAGELSEAHYNALAKRIAIHYRDHPTPADNKFNGTTNTARKGTTRKIIQP